MKRKTVVSMAAVCLVFGLSAAVPAETLAADPNMNLAAEAVKETGTLQSSSGDVISEGVYIGDVNVSGMSEAEAKSAVENTVSTAEESTITFKVDDASVAVSAKELGLQWKNTDVVDEALELGKSGNIIKRYKDTKDLENESKQYSVEYTTDESKIKSTIKSKAADLNRDAVAASLSHENGEFQVLPGESGIEVEVGKSAKKVFDYMENKWDGRSATIELEAKQTEAEDSVKNLELVKDVLGTATTYYGSTYGRNTNVENGAAKVGGHMLLPGETFSVTQAAAPFTAENGYELAPSYESGMVVDSYGGGICQVSTTLYNAVLKSELEVVERHNHTMIVTYVDPSKDAAIAEGLMDFQFANNTDAPIYIEGYAYGGELTFTIYGHETRSPERVVEYVSETTGTTDAEGVRLVANSEQAVGYLSQTQSAHQGSTAVLWKYITENGQTTTEQVNSSTYEATPVTYEVGTSTSDSATLAALQTAIANNDLTTVQAIISGSYGTTQTETTQTDAYQTDATDAYQTDATDAYQTDAPQTDAPQTDAPQTDAPQTDAPQTDAPVYDPPEDPSYTDGDIPELIE